MNPTDSTDSKEKPPKPSGSLATYITIAIAIGSVFYSHVSATTSITKDIEVLKTEKCSLENKVDSIEKRMDTVEKAIVGQAANQKALIDVLNDMKSDIRETRKEISDINKHIAKWEPASKDG